MSAIAQSPGKVDRMPSPTWGDHSLVESAQMEAFGRLACGVAHDFNNLLNGIMLYCELLTAGLENDCPLRCHVEEIRNAGSHGAALVQRLLREARPHFVEAGTLSWNEVIAGSRNFMARMLGEKNELITVLADDLGYVKMDPAQLRQILFNLVLNAQDAMPEGGRVTLETRNSINWLPDPGDPRPRHAPCIEFTVTDTGHGMDAETRSHLFELYFTTKSPGHGNGLGLATVNTIVTQHGGFLHVESKLGSGTRVTVCLPRVASNTQQCQLQNESFVSQCLSAGVAE